MIKKVLVSFLFFFHFGLKDVLSQDVLSEPTNESLRKLIVDELILKIQKKEDSKSTTIGVIMISISEKSEVDLKFITGKPEEQVLSLNNESIEKFQNKLSSLETSEIINCILLFPFLLEETSLSRVGDKFEETIQKLLPEIRFEDVDCLHYLPPYIGLK